jgi:cytochrome c-type biogenesis protein CcmH/NrfG
MMRIRVPVAVALLAAVLTASCSGCRTSPPPSEMPEATYRETVTAFYTGLAAMQTSQDELARQSLDRVTALAPDEAAGWANLGLLLLRQQDVDGAMPHLTKAASLAPASGHAQRLLALAESRRGNVDASIGHWRRAVELDPTDAKAAYALAQEVERQGEGRGDAEAQRVLTALVDRADNLVARLDLARLAARSGDGAVLSRVLEPVRAAASAWPPEVQQRLAAVDDAATANPRAAAPAIAFLKNVLLRVPEYRRALAAVSTPREEVGEPFERFVALKNPDPQPAAADGTITFAVEPVAGVPAPVGYAGVFVAGETAAPVVLTADASSVRVGDRVAGAFPGGRQGTPPTIRGVVAADLNYDYRTDLVLAGDGGLRILRQQEDGSFVDVTRQTRLPASVRDAPMWGAWVADIDTEGDLDIVLAPMTGPTLVARNNGDGTFAVIHPFAEMAALRAFTWTDIDRDLVPDGILLSAAGERRFYFNLRGGQFRAESETQELREAAAVGEAWGRGRVNADLDNNGAADALLSTPVSTEARLANAPGAAPLSVTLPFRVTAAADLDGDGRVDLVGIDEGSAAVVGRNRGSRAYHHQVIRPKSATVLGDQRINSFGIGGVVEVRTGLHVQRIPIVAPIVHVGLGEASRAEVARVFWPNGTIQSEFGLAADATVAATQRLKGSCPWLFAWNGREMAFVTDLIWRSPLGLRINAQATAAVQTTEDWVKVRGDQLVAREGHYDLRVTAELWETHFFDRLALAYVDHPAGTEVFVDERFAVPAPPLDVALTGPVTAFASVRDDVGNDVSAVVATRDDRHLDFAGRGAFQGITRDHYVELELPDEAPRTGPLWLIGRGWVHPTDSSINVAISQGAHAAPRGLSLHVADASGRFREVRSGLGFPSGKDKTVRLDLEGLFPPTGPRRLRLATNLEVYWDRLGWAAGPRDRARVRLLPLDRAELRYRGYSVTTKPDAGTPERPVYRLAGTAPRWADLEGYHTRFGDVRPLVTATDDRYVIMNAGDELVLAFTEAPPLPPGMTRDFVMIGDGWVKDGDFNTTSSRTVLPLPTHASGRYDRGAGAIEDDPVFRRHREDFERYHTRYVWPRIAAGAARRAASVSDSRVRQ